MNLKKIKIILYLPFILFFIANIFYYPLPAKAEEVCKWYEAHDCTEEYAKKPGLVQYYINKALEKCGAKPSGIKAYSCCCENVTSSGLNDSMPQWKNPLENLQVKIPGLTFTPTKQIQANCREENGKKICNFPWIGEYIAGVYKYAIGIVGILAAVVLMVGGVLWIIAGGNATMIGEAKAWIGASLTGLVIALCSYLILYQINPALTIFQPLGITQVAKAPEAEVTAVSEVCKNYLDPTGTNTIKYDSIKLTDRTDYPTNCSNYTFSGKYAKYLKAIAATESSCQPQAQSGAGSCGLMQLRPDTAKIYDSRATCQWLKDNPDESIKIAAQFIEAYTNVHGGMPTKIFAGYNSGYSTSPNPTNGKKGGLAPSSDCPGFKAFECCINPGELAETQTYIYRAIKFFHSDPY